MFAVCSLQYVLFIQLQKGKQDASMWSVHFSQISVPRYSVVIWSMGNYFALKRFGQGSMGKELSLEDGYSFRSVSVFQCISTLLGTNRLFSCLSRPRLWMHPGCLSSLGNHTSQSAGRRLLKSSWWDLEHLVLNVKKGMAMLWKR